MHHVRERRTVRNKTSGEAMPTHPLTSQDISEFLARNVDRACLLARRILGDWEAAQDAVQEACLRCVRQPPERREAREMTAYFLQRVVWVAQEMRSNETARKDREEKRGAIGPRPSPQR